MWTSGDRWTCPDCRATEVPQVPERMIREAIRQLQVLHGREHAAERARKARLSIHERRGWITVDDLLAEFRPGSHGPGWTWDDEAADLLALPCLCPSRPPALVVECDTPGHYQLMLEDHLRDRGQVDQPICLGTDGRVWDGHHRVVAAIRLGFPQLPVERPNAARRARSAATALLTPPTRPVPGAARRPAPQPAGRRGDRHG